MGNVDPPIFSPFDSKSESLLVTCLSCDLGALGMHITAFFQPLSRDGLLMPIQPACDLGLGHSDF